MATVIVRVNPNRKLTVDGSWECSQCHRMFDDFDEARECAIADYESRTGRSAERSVAV